MDSNNTTPKVMKETKDKIRVDFDRTPLKDRLKAKFINSYFVKNVVFKLFRFLFLLGIAYVVLYPFITKISSSFMSPDDFVDTTVMLIPKEFTLDTYKAIWTELNFFDSIKHTFIISFTCAILQTFFCAFIAYGFAKYKFKGNGILFLVVILTMIIPHFVLSEAMMNFFGNFNPYGIVSLLTGGGSALPAEWQGTGLGNGLKLTMTWIPLVILSVTGLGFKNGLYIFMLRQFFKGIPDSLEESAYIDGSGDFRTFFTIILPMSVPMLITVFLFAFCWQWTDTFYTTQILMLTDIYTPLPTMVQNVKDVLEALGAENHEGLELIKGAIRNTVGIISLIPITVLFVFLQRYLVEGIERSGLTAE